jgi:hypothetical protein
MRKLYELRPLWAFGIFIVLDTLCVGMGMGVPIFCILFGFPVGWFAVKYITRRITSMPQVFRRVLFYAMLTSTVTLFWMTAIWGPTIAILSDPTRDLANFGVPMILYEPLASFIGWIVLMILISPFLQFLTTLFGSYLALLGWMNKSVGIQQSEL